MVPSPARDHSMTLEPLIAGIGMCSDRVLGSFEEMRIELVAQRLVIRAMLAYLACADKKSAGQTLAQIAASLEGTGPYAVIVEDLDDDLRAAATERARDRMAGFTTDIQKLPIARA
jgi:hypothetical protein